MYHSVTLPSRCHTSTVKIMDNKFPQDRESTVQKIYNLRLSALSISTKRYMKNRTINSKENNSWYYKQRKHRIGWERSSQLLSWINWTPWGGLVCVCVSAVVLPWGASFLMPSLWHPPIGCPQTQRLPPSYQLNPSQCYYKLYRCGGRGVQFMPLQRPQTKQITPPLHYIPISSPIRLIPSPSLTPIRACHELHPAVFLSKVHNAQVILVLWSILQG